MDRHTIARMYISKKGKIKVLTITKRITSKSSLMKDSARNWIGDWVELTEQQREDTGLLR